MFGFGESTSTNSTILGEMTMSLDGNGTVLTSSGALENKETVSAGVTQAVKVLGLYTTPSEDESSALTYKKVSFIYSDRAYVVVRTGNKLTVTLKKVDERPSIHHFTNNDSAEDSDLSDDRSHHH